MTMTDRELVSIIKHHRANSLGTEDGDLSRQRAEAMNHYHGRPYGNEVEGRSQVVSRDLAEAIDGAMPPIMKVFVQSGAVAEFCPVGPDDEQLAQQETDYVNKVFMVDNNGFMVLHDGIKDTLMLKNGYIKHWWEVEDKITTESYTGLSMEQITQMVGDFERDGAEVDVVGQDSRFVELPAPVMPGMPPQPPMMVEMFDVRLKIKRKCGRVHVMAVPCEEVRVSRNCRGSLQDSPFTEHAPRKTRSDLIEMGMPRSFVDELPAFKGRNNDTERRARDSVIDETDETGINTVIDKSMDEIEYCEAYLRVDYDGDGVAELRKVVTVADKIPPGEQWNEQIEAVPMTGLVAKRVPHRHVGESLDDDLHDLQEILTTLKRQLLDNVYLLNNSEIAVNDRANLKDFMVRQPGGVKRIKGSEPVNGAYAQFQVPSIIGDVLPVIQHYDQEKEDRTGISRAGQGLDPDALQDVTKGAYQENMRRLSEKLEMMTRLLAEGVKEAMVQVHGLLIRHQDKPKMVELRGKWVEVNPQEWKERNDLVVRVGLGTGNEEEKINKLGKLIQLQDRLGPQGMVSPQNAYNLAEDVTECLGFDMPEKYFLSPDSPEFKAQMEARKNAPNPQVQIEQMKAQAKAQADQMDMQMQERLEQQRMTMQAQVDSHRQEVEAQQKAAEAQLTAQLEAQKAAHAAQLEQARLEFDRWKAQLDNETKVLVAQIQAGARASAAPQDGAM